MAYSLQFGKSTTLGADMTISETTSGTLSSAAFTNFVGDYLVLDYNIPAKREVIKCTVTGTAISSITRAQEGTSAIAHSSGALVGYNFVPSHYGDLGKIAAGDTWTSYTPTWTAATANPVLNSGTKSGYYLQLGKTVWFRVLITMAADTTYGTGGWFVSLPVNAAAGYALGHIIGTARIDDSGAGFPANAVIFDATKVTLGIFNASSTYATIATASGGTPATLSTGDYIYLEGCYETA